MKTDDDDLNTYNAAICYKEMNSKKIDLNFPFLLNNFLFIFLVLLVILVVVV